MAGLTPQGFEKKTLAEIKEELEDDFRGVFGVFINLLPASVFSLIIGIFAERLSEIWDVAEEVHLSAYPDTAEGVSLDNIGALNAIERLEAAPTRVPGFLLFGDEGTVIPSTARFSVVGVPQRLFRPLNQVILADGQNSIQELSFSSVPDSGNFTLTYSDGVVEETTETIAFNATAEDVEEALNDLDLLSEVEVIGNFTSGFEIDFAGVNGKQAQELLSVTSNSLFESATPVTIDVTEEQVGQPQGQVELRSVESGAIAAPRNQLTVIATPINGLDRVVNPQVAIPGRDLEEDPEYRLRRDESLSIQGNASVEAIRAKVRNLEGVQDAFVFENDTLATNIQGVPGKSFEVVVSGGEDLDIANAIWLAKGAGIRPHGSIPVTIIDSQGEDREIRFTRPTPVPIFVSVDLYIDPVTFPEGGQLLARNSLIEWGNSLGIGTNVIVYPRLVAVFAPIAGVKNVGVRVDTSAVSTTPESAAVDDNITILGTQVSEWTVVNTNINIIGPS